MTRERTFEPEQPFPSDWPNGAADYLATLVSGAFAVTIKAADNTVLQVVAGVNNDRRVVGVEGRWRWLDATIESGGPGGGVARFLDVYLTSSDNVFTPSSPGEIDSTVRAPALAIVESGAAPAGVALKRKVAWAWWDGAKFTAVDMIVGPASGTARHASSHAIGGADPITPESIGAIVAGDLGNMPTAGQKAALAGTSGAPSDGNRYVTAGDARLDDARVPTAHAGSHDPTGSDRVRMENWMPRGTYAAMPPAAAALNGVRYVVSDKAMEFECIAGAWVLVNTWAPLVFALPGSPVEGQECVFSAAVNGVLWHLRFNSGTGMWDFLGGSDLFAEILPDQTTTGAVFGDLTTIGPSVSLPLSMDADVTVGAHIYSTGLNNASSLMSYANGGAAAVDADACRLTQPSGGQSMEADETRTRRKTGLAAGSSLVAKHRGDAAATHHFSNRTIRVHPIRVW